MGDDEEDSLFRRASRGIYRENKRLFILWALLGIALALVFIRAVLVVITPFVFGVFLYYGTRPIYKRLKKFGVPGEIAASISLLAIALPALIVIGAVLLIAVNQAFILVQTEGLSSLQFVFDNLNISGINVEEYSSMSDLLTSDGLRTVITQSWGAISGFTSTVVWFIFNIFMAFSFAFFMFGWGPKGKEEALELFDDEEILRSYLTNLDKDLSSVFFGNMMNAILTSLIGAVIYSGLNTWTTSTVLIPAPVLVGILTGIASFVPLVGSKIVYTPLAGYMAFQAYSFNDPTGYGFALVFFLVALFIVDLLPDIFLRPIISGRSTSQGALFIAYLIGPLVFGFTGIFLMPIIVLAFINFRKIVLPGFKTKT